MRITMIKNAIGKDLTQVKRVEVIKSVKKDAELFNILASMLTYTEGEYNNRSELENGMRKLSRYIDRALGLWSK